jgi:hypothetical protein
MQNWQVVEKVLEALFYLSGMGLFVTAVLGLRQLSLAKKSLSQSAQLFRVSAMREAFRLAADQCDLYANRLIPLINECDRKLRELGASEILEKFKVAVDREGIRIVPPEGFRRECEPGCVLLQYQAEEEILRIANALEALAVPFVSGVAAEGVAFSSIGPSFCFSVGRYAPVILPLAGRKHFQNLFELFHLWRTRIDCEELRERQKEISKKLGSVQEITIRPLGT